MSITRHKHEESGTVFQVHHDTGKVFIEKEDGLLRFSGGCPKRTAALPELKDDCSDACENTFEPAIEAAEPQAVPELPPELPVLLPTTKRGKSKE